MSHCVVHRSKEAMLMRTTIWICTTIFLLSGCAGLVPGTSREADVTAYFGQAAEQRKLPDGGRVLDFPRAPLGYENWRVTLGRDGTVRSVEQLLDETHLARIKPGMTMDEVKRELSRHGEYAAFPALSEEVYSWRYLEPGNRRMFFNAHFNASGRVKYVSRTDEPIPMSDSNNN
jgi:hypothetical protein